MVNKTRPFNATGRPAMNVPCGMSNGLPIGMMLIGRRGDDATVLRVADAFRREIFDAQQPTGRSPLLGTKKGDKQPTQCGECRTDQNQRDKAGLVIQPAAQRIGPTPSYVQGRHQ